MGAVRGAAASGTVVDVGGSVVVVVPLLSRVGASSAARATLGVWRTMATVEPPTTITAVSVAMISARSARASGRRAHSHRSGRARRRLGGTSCDGSPSGTAASMESGTAA